MSFFRLAIACLVLGQVLSLISEEPIIPTPLTNIALFKYSSSLASAVIQDLQNLVQAFSADWRNKSGEQQPTKPNENFASENTSNTTYRLGEDVQLCVELINMTSTEQEIVLFIKDSTFSRKEGPKKTEKLIQLLRDVDQASELVDSIFARLVSSLAKEARNSGLLRFPNTSLTACRLKNDLCPALMRTGSSACRTGAPFILSSVFRFSDVFLGGNTSTIEARSLRGDLRGIISQLFSGQNQSSSTNATPAPAQHNTKPTSATSSGPWRKAFTCLKNSSCPPFFMESSQGHRLPALTTELARLASIFLNAVSKEIPGAQSIVPDSLLTCGLPCQHLPQLSDKAPDLRTAMLVFHFINVAMVVYGLATIFLSSSNRRMFAWHGSAALRAPVYMNVVCAVWSYGILRSGLHKGWCNKDGTRVMALPDSDVSFHCRAMAYLDNWGMPASTTAITWLCIVWYYTVKSNRVFDMSNRAVVGRGRWNNWFRLILELAAACTVSGLYFLFPAIKTRSKETHLVEGWPHLGTCTFLESPFAKLSFLLVFCTLTTVSGATFLGGVYFKFVYKAHLILSLNAANLNLSRRIKTTERRLMISLVALSLLIIPMLAFTPWLEASQVHMKHKTSLRAFLFCRLTSCSPENCRRFVVCTCRLRLFLRQPYYWHCQACFEILDN